jgi:hypothetical protein
MKNQTSTLSLLLAVTFVFPFLAAPANADIQFFPPSNMTACNANTALMFDGRNQVYCQAPGTITPPPLANSLNYVTP